MHDDQGPNWVLRISILKFSSSTKQRVFCTLTHRTDSVQNLNLSVHHFEPDNFQWFALFSFKFQSTRKYFTEEGPGGGGGGGEVATISENKNILWIVCNSNHVSRIWHRMTDLLSNKSIKNNWMPFVSVLTMITLNNEVQAFYGHLL